MTLAVCSTAASKIRILPRKELVQRIVVVSIPKIEARLGYGRSRLIGHFARDGDLAIATYASRRAGGD